MGHWRDSCWEKLTDPARTVPPARGTHVPQFCKAQPRSRPLPDLWITASFEPQMSRCCPAVTLGNRFSYENTVSVGWVIRCCAFLSIVLDFACHFPRASEEHGDHRKAPPRKRHKYRAKVRMRGFPSESATFERLTDAKDWASKIERDMKEGRYFGMAKRHTFKELADEYEPHAKDKVRLDYWRGVFGSLLLADLTPDRIAKQRDKLLAEETPRFATPPTGDAEADAKRPKAKRTGPTVNRYLAALSVCLAHGVKELRWLERNPCELIKKPAESRGRVRFLSDDERTKLLEACRPHADLYLALVVALTTGARRMEVMSLRWGQIDFARQVITLHDTKNGERRALPLVGEAFTLLQARSKVRNLKDDRIFPPNRHARRKPSTSTFARPGRTH